MKYKSDNSLGYCLDEFSVRMEARLERKVAEGRRGWDDPDWDIEDIKRQLIIQVEKGNMIDAANFAMFAWNKQE